MKECNGDVNTVQNKIESVGLFRNKITKDESEPISKIKNEIPELDLLFGDLAKVVGREKTSTAFSRRIGRINEPNRTEVSRDKNFIKLRRKYRCYHDHNETQLKNLFFRKSEFRENGLQRVKRESCFKGVHKDRIY